MNKFLRMIRGTIIVLSALAIIGWLVGRDSPVWVLIFWAGVGIVAAYFEFKKDKKQKS